MNGRLIRSRIPFRVVVVFAFFVAILPSSTEANNGPLRISLDLVGDADALADSMVLLVEVVNRSESLAAGLVVGPSALGQYFQVSVDGQTLKTRSAEVMTEETYELHPGDSVRFLVSWKDDVLPWLDDFDELESKGFEGDYAVAIQLAGSRSEPIDFTISKPNRPARAGHPGGETADFLQQQQEAFEAARRSTDARSTARRLARELETFIFEHRRQDYSDSRDAKAMMGLTRLLRECANVDRSLKLTGGYLLARSPLGPRGKALIRAARLEHQATDLIDHGETWEGIDLFKEIFDLLPEEVVYHVSAVQRLSNLEGDWRKEVSLIAQLGVDRYRMLDGVRPGDRFALGFFASRIDREDRQGDPIRR